MDSKTASKLRGWIRKYGTGGTLLVGCYLALHFLWFHPRRRGILVLSLLSTLVGASWVASLLKVPPHPRSGERSPAIVARKAPPPTSATMSVVPETVSAIPEADDAAALGVAAEHGDVELVKLFLGRGVDTERGTNDQGWTPLMRAAEHGHTEVVRLLLLHGAKIQHSDWIGDTAWMLRQ